MGAYEPHHPALGKLKTTMRALTAERPDSEPVYREEAWGAPGPDCLEGFWLKSFRGPVNLMKTLLWEVMDGTSEVPSWLVRGRTVMKRA